MNNINWNSPRLRQHYTSVEYCLGVACPLLSAVSFLDQWGLLGWTWLLMLWMSIGHFRLYLYNNYPKLKYRPFFQGLFVFGVGVLWPAWSTRAVPKKNLWG